MKIKSKLFLSHIFFAALLSAEQHHLRWTEAEDLNADTSHIVDVVNQKTGLELTAGDFMSIEDRELATSRYKMLAQVVDGTPVKGALLRVWSDLKSGELIQAEASVLNPTQLKALAQLPANKNLKAFQSMETLTNLVLAEIRNHEDNKLLQIQRSSRYWKDSELVQVYKIKARRGIHEITISLGSLKILEHKYREFPQVDGASAETEFSLPALVYPIYEEAEFHMGDILPRAEAELKYLRKHVRRGNGSDPYASLREQRYFYNKFDPILGLTEEGRRQGYWAMSYVKGQAASLREQFPWTENSVEGGGVILEGRYATVSIHPAAKDHFTQVNFSFRPSLQFMPSYGAEEMIPGASLLGKPLLSLNEALERPARRLPDHNTTSYINDGFDELQVYYSVNTFMESLHSMGFADPDLSTRPFNAFLYDPDIAMRDNAYYVDDTINFTTYSAKNQNYARDNSTIWHELGHGIMDRLMGDSIVLADTGGLSEGMADFLAALVIADKLEGQAYPGMNDYRIINNTGFHLTNEVHDDGEAYGGTMNDIKNAAVAAQGRAGLAKVTDLTLEAMRLTRNHPGLTAAGWFEHMLFADERGSSIRAKGELRDLIVNAYRGRNFSLDESASLAQFSLKLSDQEIIPGAPGSRPNPVPVKLRENEKSSYKLAARLEDGEEYKFDYPVTVKVYFRSGPLQGAIRWDGEENEPQSYTINRPGETIDLNFTVNGKCDQVNREDGSCVDYAYIQIWNNNAALKKPVSKKRFYVRVKPST